MAPLETLEREFPLIDSNFRQLCGSRGIFSVEDFLLHDLYELAAFAEQQSNSERLKQGITEILSIIDGQHQHWSNGMELLEDALQNKHVLSTGCEGIDLLLQGGLREGQVTELVGPSSSGKTQVCLQVASNVAKNYMGSVLYLDTGNSFSPQRIAYFINQKLNPTLKMAEQTISQEIMSRILCRPLFNIFALLAVLHQLEPNLRSQLQSGDDRVHLLVIDSMSSLIAPVLGSSSSEISASLDLETVSVSFQALVSRTEPMEGRALMVSAGFLLKKLAHEHHLAVLVTNHMVAEEGGALKPALGEGWKSIPHARLLLTRHPRTSSCNMSVIKHTVTASGKSARFMMDQ